MNNGGPAFPSSHTLQPYNGMSLRDYAEIQILKEAFAAIMADTRGMNRLSDKALEEMITETPAVIAAKVVSAWLAAREQHDE